MSDLKILPCRICDYFILVEESINKRKILSRFPKVDHSDAEFPKDLPLFCFPCEAKVFIHNSYKIFYFVLTEGDGTRIYSVTLCYKCENDVYRAIVLTSHWSFLTQHKEFLETIYMDIKNNKIFSIPLERILSNFIFEIPLPPSGKKIVSSRSLPGLSLIFKRAQPNKLSFENIDFHILFKCLNVTQVLLLFRCIITEKRILLKTESIEYLTNVSETLRMILFPFYWHHIYIPVMPSSFIDFISAPMPYLCGILSYYVIDEIILKDVIVVDLDKNNIRIPENEKIVELPEKESNKLRKGLAKEYSKVGLFKGTNNEKCDKINSRNVRKLFLNFFVKILQNYSSFIAVKAETVPKKFDKKKFIETKTTSSIPFYEVFLDTQIFSCFVDDRYNLNTANAANMEILFFNECVNDLKTKSDFLRDTSMDHNETFVCLSPDASNLPRRIYKYTTLPLIDEKLISKPRKVRPFVNKMELMQIGAKLNVSNPYMEYFKKKLLYSKNINELRKRTSTLGNQFTTIMDFYLEWQGIDVLKRYCFSLLNKKISEINVYKTNTTIDNAWKQLLIFLQKEIGESFSVSEILQNITLKTFISNLEKKNTELSVIFENYKELENMISYRKNTLEESKRNKLEAESKLMCHDSKVFNNISSKDVSNIITSHKNYDKTSIKHETDFIFFDNFYKYYDREMQKMIYSICDLNEERLALFKYNLEVFIESKEKTIGHVLNNLEVLKKVSNEINIKKDKTSFRISFKNNQKEYKKKHPQLLKIVNKSNSLSSIENSGKSKINKQSIFSTISKSSSILVDDNYEKIDHESLPSFSSYAIMLHGEIGYNRALNQLNNSKTIMKNFALFLESVYKIFELMISSNLKLMKREFAPNSDKKSYKNKIWMTHLRMTETFLKHESQLVNSLKNCTLKLQCQSANHKNAYNTLNDRVKEVSNQITVYTDNVHKANEKMKSAIKARSSALSAYKKKESEVLQLSSSPEQGVEDFKQYLISYKITNISYSQAVSSWEKKKSLLEIMKHNQELSMAYIFEIFQEKENLKFETIQNILKYLIEIFYKYFNTYSSSMNTFHQNILSMKNQKEENSLGNANKNENSFEGKDHKKYLSFMNIMNDSYKEILNMNSFLSDKLSLDETHIKNIKKLFTSNTFFSKLGKKESLNVALEELFNFIKGIFNRKINSNIQGRKGIIKFITDFLKEYRTEYNKINKKYIKVSNNLDNEKSLLKKDKDKLKQIEQILSNVDEKIINRKIKKHSSKQHILNAFKTSLTSLNNERELLVQNHIELVSSVNKLTSNVVKLKENKMNITKKNIERLNVLNLKRHHFYKSSMNMLYEEENKTLKIYRSLHKKFHMVYNNISSENDLEYFLKKNKTISRPSKVAIEYIYKKNEEKFKNLLKRNRNLSAKKSRVESTNENMSIWDFMGLKVPHSFKFLDLNAPETTSDDRKIKDKLESALLKPIKFINRTRFKSISRNTFHDKLSKYTAKTKIRSKSSQRNVGKDEYHHRLSE